MMLLPPVLGNTSACAEKSTSSRLATTDPRKYLRMRGEELEVALCVIDGQEIPPHARRRAFPRG